MKSGFLIRIAVVSVSAALAGPVGLAAQQRQEQSRKVPHYKLIILPTLGGAFGNGWAVNNRGWVAGHSTLPDRKERGTHRTVRENGESQVRMTANSKFDRLRFAS
jgi:hypothetical protein